MQGTITALITPFNEDGSLDLKGLERNIHDQIDAGIDGILVLGTTGEAPTLSSEEKTLIIKTARRETKGHVPLIVGTGHNATSIAIEQTKKAENLDADAALIVTPYYNKPTEEGIFAHFSQIAKHTSIPLIAYNIPGRAACNISPFLMQKLSTIKNVIANKEASGSISQLAMMIEKAPNLAHLSGDDLLTMPMISIGAKGVISVTSNLMPKEMHALVSNCLNGDFARAQEIFYRLSSLFRALFIETNPIPIKTAMREKGKPAGPVRLPLCPMQKENHTKLMEVLSHYD